MADRGREFAALVHQVLVMERRFTVENVAKAFGVDYDTFYARIANRVKFTAEEIRLLIAAAPDPRFVTYLLDGTPFIAADRPVIGDDESVTDSLLRTAMNMVREAFDAAEAIEVAVRDNLIDHREALVIRREIEVAERAIATVRKNVDRYLE